MTAATLVFYLSIPHALTCVKDIVPFGTSSATEVRMEALDTLHAH